MTSSDEVIRDVLAQTRTIAIVGISHKTERPSHGVARFLQRIGYRIVPVNPGLAGQMLLGEKVFASLGDIPPKSALSRWSTSSADPRLSDRLSTTPSPT